MKALSLVTALALCLSAAGASAETIRNREIGFTLELPAGARNFPQGMQGPDMIHSYILKHPSVEGSLLTFTIERMRGTIGRSKMTEEQIRRERAKQSDDPRIKAIPPDAEFDLIDETWQGLEIQVLRMRANVQGIRVVAYIAQVPLRREAIQITVGCGQGNADEGRQLLRTLLANLHGESNWTKGGGERLPRRLSESERSSRFFSGIGRMLVVVIVVLLIVWVALRSARSRRATRGPMPPGPPPYGPQGPLPPVQY